MRTSDKQGKSWGSYEHDLKASSDLYRVNSTWIFNVDYVASVSEGITISGGCEKHRSSKKFVSSEFAKLCKFNLLKSFPAFYKYNTTMEEHDGECSLSTLPSLTWQAYCDGKTC